ncbi:MAG: TetR/AcrR family transcriptional regulator [Phycisphaerales bacterium]
MRDRILQAAEEMVQQRGLNGVSFAQLAKAVGLSKPSVFHHFPNKEALAKALVQLCQDKYGAEYGGIIDSDATAPEKLQRIADSFEQGLRVDRLCLLGMIGQGLGDLSSEVQDDLRLSATRSIDRFSQVFEQGRRDGSLSYEGTSEAAGAAFLAMLEGLQVLARSKRDPDMFTRAAKGYINSLIA